jgi:chromosome segregation ATPase
VRRSGEGQEPCRQGHPEGQPRASAEEHIQELSDELMRTYHSRDFKTDDLDDTRTRLQHAQDELVAAQSYVHHLETELHERDEQLEASLAQAADLQHQVEHFQELIPPEPEEDPEEIKGMYNVDDD